MGAKDKEHTMSHNPSTRIAYRHYIGKNSFHIVGLDGAIVLRQKWSRGQVEARFANMPPCLIGMETCVGAHHARRLVPKRIGFHRAGGFAGGGCRRVGIKTRIDLLVGRLGQARPILILSQQ